MLFERLETTIPADDDGEPAPSPPSRKQAGAYYTPDAVVATLVRWAVRDATDRLLDPSCGDGRFVAIHRNSVGVEQDPAAADVARGRAPHATVHRADFFAWAASTRERFTCAAGNPPFIRYQTFKGETRRRALAVCAAQGADFSGLASSWAPFLVAAAGLLAPGGRMAFVVPAEIGHTPYAAPLLEYLVRSFATVHVVACRDKLFPELSEDCWLLYADGFGASTDEVRFTALEAFHPSPSPPVRFVPVSTREWRQSWNRRLRPFLMSAAARELYREAADAPITRRLGDLAAVGIGYVTGANDFFHLRPSEAERWAIPPGFLLPAVRNGRALSSGRLTPADVDEWRRRDEPVLLLNLPKGAALPAAVRRYLDSPQGWVVRQAYKCRTREPWYAVPDVQVPDYFLSYMSGLRPSLVRNEAGCAGTNSVLAVRLRRPAAGDAPDLSEAWRSPLVPLSCEIEGHPLGGGMLKLEPREAARVVVPSGVPAAGAGVIMDATATLRAWRHYGVA